MKLLLIALVIFIIYICLTTTYRIVYPNNVQMVEGLSDKLIPYDPYNPTRSRQVYENSMFLTYPIQLRDLHDVYYCNDSDRNRKNCNNEMDSLPVCGYNRKIKLGIFAPGRAPRPNDLSKDFTNPCEACRDPSIKYYQPGLCKDQPFPDSRQRFFTSDYGSTNIKNI